ncbi:MAG: zinc-ribbon domain-containing protein [Lachnospiraceae bacterium]|nr:zinc-ribbon domain-containing protein [Lachnospiraceae bacterium]
MFCFQCGQQLPDNAKFCMKCGTSLQNVGSTDNDEKLIEKEYIIHRFGNKTIKISKDYEPYIDIFQAVQKNEETKVEEFVNFYYSSVHSFDDILDKAIPTLFEKIRETLSFVITVLMKYGVDDIDEEQLREVLESRVKPDNYLNVYFEKAEAIQTEIERIKGYRGVERASRGRWQGGGFGIGGAIKGAVTAGAMNMVTGAFRGIGDSITNASDRKRIQNMKENAFHAQDNVQILADGLGHDCLVVFYGIYEILSGHGVLPRLDMKTSAEETRLNNYMKRNNYGETISSIIACIEKNPFWSYPYELLCEMSPVNVNDILAIAHHYSVKTDMDFESDQQKEAEEWENRKKKAEKNKRYVDQLIEEMKFDKVVELIEKGNLYAEYAIVHFFENLCEHDIETNNRSILDEIKGTVRGLPGSGDLLRYIYWALCYRFGWENDENLKEDAEEHILQIANKGSVASAQVQRAFWGCQGYIHKLNDKKECLSVLKDYAKKEHPTAMAWIGIYYLEGKLGLPKDIEIAKRYLTIAKIYGQGAAIKALDKLN